MRFTISTVQVSDYRHDQPYLYDGSNGDNRPLRSQEAYACGLYRIHSVPGRHGVGILHELWGFLCPVWTIVVYCFTCIWIGCRHLGFYQRSISQLSAGSRTGSRKLHTLVYGGCYFLDISYDRRKIRRTCLCLLCCMYDWTAALGYTRHARNKRNIS